jgi:hypothetical protein
MLVATRDDGPHAHPVPYGPATPPRSLASRFTGGVQLVGSLVGIPLALIGGYSTYHANFSPEGKCQALRANIVSMLDKKTDASTLRLLVQKDVVTFERECGSVDADAAAAFRTLLAADKTPVVAHRVAPPARVEKPAPIEKVEAVVAQPPAKVEKAEKAEKVEKREPLKREAVKTPAKETPARESSTKESSTKEAVAKLEQPKQLGTPPHPLVAPPAAEKAAAPPQAATQVETPAEKPIEKAVEAPKPAEPAPVSPAVAQPEKTDVDATWVASVRDALRESASQPAADATSEAAPALSAPINIAPEAQAASNATPERRGELVPPADIPPAPRSFAPRPPGLIPNAN